MDDKIKYQELKDKLKNAGCDVDMDMCNTKGFIFPKEYDYILCEYLGVFKNHGLNSNIIHCLAQPKKYSMIPILLREFYCAPSSTFDYYRWYLGDGLYKIGYKDEFFYDYIEIVSNVQYGESRQMIVLLLGRSKRQEALEKLITLMNNWDYDIMKETLSALNLFKSERVYNEVKIFSEKLISEKGKEKYIKDMYEVSSQFHKNYTDSEKKRYVQEMYTEVIMRVNKILKRHSGEIPKDRRRLFEKVSE